MNSNPYLGSSLDELLEEDNILAEVDAIALKRVHAWQTEQKMMKQLKILFLAADPKDASRLRLLQEQQTIKDQLKQSDYRNSFSIEIQIANHRDKILEVIGTFNPQIVHFAGHGTKTGELCFEDEQGNTKLLKPKEFASWFGEVPEDLSCVVLNACHSKTQAENIFKYVSCIGMDGEIGDRSAIEFATDFYCSLGAGFVPEKAFDTAIEKMRKKGNPDYLTPVLYLKDDVTASVQLTQAMPPSLKFTNENSFISKKNIDYSKLKDYLSAGNWKEADYLTYLLMVEAVGKKQGDWISNKEMRKFPNSDLEIIDRLWISYSNGRFGFSVQNKIWCETFKQDNFLKNPFSRPGEKFALYVGWLNEQGLFKERDDLDFSLDAPEGHLPCTLRVSGRLRKEVGYWLFSPISFKFTNHAK